MLETSALPSRDTMIRRNRHSASRVAFHGTRLSRFIPNVNLTKSHFGSQSLPFCSATRGTRVSRMPAISLTGSRSAAQLELIRLRLAAGMSMPGHASSGRSMAGLRALWRASSLP
jgi:hypothetical protein